QALPHDEGAGPGHRALPQQDDRGGAPRPHRGGERGGPGHHVPRAAAGGGRVSGATPAVSAKPKLLVVDDDEDLRRQMRWALADEYEVLLAADRLAALDAVRAHRPTLVTLDLGLPPDAQGAAEGMAALFQIQQLEDPPKVVVITGREEREHALRAVEQGAYDYFCKPIQAEELKVVLRRALFLQQVEHESRE